MIIEHLTTDEEYAASVRYVRVHTLKFSQKFSQTKIKNPLRAISKRVLWCLGRESNPYGHCCPRDFKSRVSTYSTTKAIRVQR